MVERQALTHTQQIAAMQAAYPNLRVVMRGRLGTVWQGPLTGFDRIYLMQFALWRGLVAEEWESINFGVEALVLSPNLAAESGGLHRLPHVYQSHHHPRLCLYDPEACDWNRHMAIAETIVPWAAQWLAFYELWQITGRWTGPERHPEPDLLPSPASLRVAINVAPSLRQIRQVSQRSGTEGSKPLLEAAAGNRLPSLRRDWMWRAAQEVPLPFPDLEGA